MYVLSTLSLCVSAIVVKRHMSTYLLVVCVWPVLGGDLCSVLGVSGVPMVVILHPSGNCQVMSIVHCTVPVTNLICLMNEILFLSVRHTRQFSQACS